MADVLVVSGSGAFADPWHPFPVTSARIAEAIGDLGWTVEVSEEVEARLTDPGECRLLVLNIGNPAEPPAAGRVAEMQTGLHTHLARGGALLGVHAAATSLTTMSDWPGLLGGRWVRGTSMHPPQGHAQVVRTATEHPVSAGLDSFEVFDERYSYLATQPDVTVLYEHMHDARRHPLVWVRDGVRVGYDALGHDARSYDSPGRVELLQRLVRWLIGDR